MKDLTDIKRPTQEQQGWAEALKGSKESKQTNPSIKTAGPQALIPMSKEKKQNNWYYTEDYNGNF
jgi:hypothetical protein